MRRKPPSLPALPRVSAGLTGSSMAPLILAATMLATAPAGAHELDSSRATILLRDGNHVSMTLYINLPEVLRRTIAPERGFGEFVLVYSAMPPEKFRDAVKAAESRLADTTRLTDAAGASPARSGWTWPDPERTQAEFRMLAAAFLTAPSEPPHDDPVAVHAEFQTARPTSSLKVTFPPQLDAVLTVYYRPQQVWLGPGKPSPPLNF